MRKSLVGTSLVVGIGLLLSACGGNPDVPPKVSWSYGAGNGDPVTASGPPPTYSFTYGLSKDVPVSSGQAPTVQYGYGAENENGVMVQMAPPAPPNQQLAAPARPTTTTGSHI